MAVLIVGSAALDTIETNGKKAKDALGGSAVYSSVSASYFAKPYIVAAVGNDFPEEHIDLLKKHGIDVSGMRICSGKTFRWKGRYSCDLNHAKTINTKLNVFERFSPVLSEKHKKNGYLLLANVDPEIQDKVLALAGGDKFVAADTMNLWISKKLKKLKSVLRKTDLLFINEDESRQLSHEQNIVRSAKKIMKMGPGILVIKRGEFGAVLFYKNEMFSVPSFPLEQVQDTTGAGDTFAGGFVGYLASCGKTNFKSLKKAMVYGSIMASFNVEAFSLKGISFLTKGEINARFRTFKKITEF